MKTWYITGGTPGGFGMAYANAALESGDRVVLTTRRPEELREWAARHAQPGSGWIVNMSSVAGLAGVLGFGFYTAAKFAVEGLTEALRQEVAPFGVKVLAVEPGPSVREPTRASPTNRWKRASWNMGRCSRRCVPA
ncbi:SDR family NAD(P)-dependent oxidoreductase [Nonomuraea fuscirosea]|uniref:SDR family NAD(P)-dependent oxidoreductase n=1 Tax=Nonomuraea fuscirosea TaxID=1291556 RepID=UPI003447C261